MNKRIKHAIFLCSILFLLFAKTANAQDVKPEDIIANYIKAIGGRDNLNKVNTIYTTGTMNIQGHSFSCVRKMMSPNKQMMSMSMNGNEILKTVFNGTTGYQIQMGNKSDLPNDDLKIYSNDKSLFPQLFFTTQEYRLSYQGVENVGDKPAHKIEIIYPSGFKTIDYYDTVSALLVREVVPENDGEQSVTFDNYRTINGILIPYNSTATIITKEGALSMDMIADSIKINEGVTEEDFE